MRIVPVAYAMAPTGGEGAGGDRGTEYPAGSYSSGDRDSAEVGSECGGRVSEREGSIETVSAL